MVIPDLWISAAARHWPRVQNDTRQSRSPTSQALRMPHHLFFSNIPAGGIQWQGSEPAAPSQNRTLLTAYPPLTCGAGAPAQPAQPRARRHRQAAVPIYQQSRRDSS